LLRRTVERWRSDAASHSLVLDLDESLPVRGDPGRIEQVLDNLLQNAVKYSPSGTTIRVTGRAVGQEARLTVADQGQGIPEAEQERIFDRFYRRPEHRSGGQSGLGLGLFITRELVLAQDGRIWVESQEGRGTTFVVAFPLRTGATELPKSA
jgi:signal transduction histidine kinase